MMSLRASLYVFFLLLFSINATGQQSTITAGATTALPGAADITLVTGDASASTFRVFNSANTELFRVTATGNVGIGVSSPTAKLHVNGDIIVDNLLNTNRIGNLSITNAGDLNAGLGSPGGTLWFNSPAKFYTGTLELTSWHPSPFDVAQLRTGHPIVFSVAPSVNGSVTEALRITSAGLVGVNNAAPTERLEVSGGSIYVNSGDSGLIVDSNNLKRFGIVKGSGRDTELRYLNSIPFKIRRITSGTDVRSGSATSDVAMTFTAAGNVGVGLDTPNDAYKLHVGGNAHFNGSVTADGTLAAKYQDVAEWVPSRHDLDPGTVVVLDDLRSNGVMASTKPYDTAVAGVVSLQPGLILGEGAADKEQIATTGRVRVKVDATAGAIRVGDLLVTSSKAGFAMKSTPIDLSGVAIHRPGTIIGKALEPLQGGEGEILVLLSLQ